jgi:integrase
MSNISLLLQIVHENVHAFSMKLNFSEPKIYTGGVNIHKWSSLTQKEQKCAMEKDWYLYFSFRDPETGKLKRQPNIKAGANRYKNKRDRIALLKTLRTNLIVLLDAGFNPYIDNTTLEKTFMGEKTPLKTPSNTLEKTFLGEKTPLKTPPHTPIKLTEKPGNTLLKHPILSKTTPVQSIDSEEITLSVIKALELGLKTKQSVLNENSFPKFKSRINRFKRWMAEKELLEKPIESITKKLVINYLNNVLDESSARNRNNTRTDLSSLFQTLEDNEIIPENFVKKINVLRAIPERNKTYTPKLQKDIYEYLRENDPLLLLFVKFISFNFLRPIEVCRLRVKDIDLLDKKLYVRAKNKPVKIKIIPEILLSELTDLANLDKECQLFTPEKIGGIWNISDLNKRDYFTKRFKKVKEHFNLGKDYGLYSFRHTFITQLYREMVKNSSPHAAKSKLMLITGHADMKGLENYLRDIDAALPDDYSHFLNPSYPKNPVS